MMRVSCLLLACCFGLAGCSSEKDSVGQRPAAAVRMNRAQEDWKHLKAEQGLVYNGRHKEAQDSLGGVQVPRGSLKMPHDVVSAEMLWQQGNRREAAKLFASVAMRLPEFKRTRTAIPPIPRFKQGDEDRLAAHFINGMAHYWSGRYGEAKDAFEFCMTLSEDPRIREWRDFMAEFGSPRGVKIRLAMDRWSPRFRKRSDRSCR
jgi:hypothetical protein